MAYQRSPQNQQTLNKSLSLFQSGRPDKAEKLARSILATEPRNGELLQFVAMLCQSQEKFAEAVALCTKAVTIHPNSAGAHYNLGTALMKQGRNAHAVASLEKSLALAPASYDALNNLAVALTAADRAAEAEQAARRAIAMAPGAPMAHNSLGLALAKQMRLGEAAESFEAALARGHPDPAHVLDKLGLTYIDLERPKAAIECLRRALVQKPKALDLTMRLGGTQNSSERSYWCDADLPGGDTAGTARSFALGGIRFFMPACVRVGGVCTSRPQDRKDAAQPVERDPAVQRAVLFR